ncbi:hypothetical protein AB205_0011640 [Aquarana catesbeiana]|uniref:Gypsy retrotransposon integrase-like protein 1 n=1 Tax=Aquarana catesbeiana TaxID=8400 RepID=A0A2G9QC25_AQUCT|nr:hypothetical protein AB205_0011640 [Aquarana catesbeiana]
MSLLLWPITAPEPQYPEGRWTLLSRGDSGDIAGSCVGLENKWQEVYNYLAQGAYPSGSSKNDQRALRKYASNFSINEGNLFYGKRRAIQNKDEAKSIFNQFHTSPIGGHTDMRKTRSAVCSRFYWNAMTVHIDNWVLECEQCQKVGKPLKGSQPLQFIKLNIGLCTLLRIERSVTAAYHPQRNGLDEKTNDNIKRQVSFVFVIVPSLYIFVPVFE